ncbi:MAG: translation initiation factor eIF-2B [Nanoarchaeota archaeon]|nr:translation initiation factor eIF-2B [Nanoarchaeota archaeon]
MSIEQTYQDIKSLKIQGASNISDAAIKEIKNLVKKSTAKKPHLLTEEIETGIEKLKSARPTEPETENYLNYINYFSKRVITQKISELKSEILKEINNIQKEKEKSTLLIINNAQKLLKGNQKIFTHCHSSTVMEILKQVHRSKNIRVNNTETRPLFQGRITAKELSQAKIPVEHYTDTAARIAIKDSDIMLIGADSITYNKVYNKIGSEMISIIAKHEKIPVYICASLMKFTNQREEIENRHPNEVWKDAPKGIHINNPAFEKIAFKYIKGIICEKGILKPKKYVKEARKMLKAFSL